MITDNSIVAIEGLADSLTERDVYVTADVESPLSLMVKASIPAVDHESPVAVPDYIRDMKVAAASTNLLNENVHGDILDEYAEAIGKSVAGSVNLARNVVNPMIREMSDFIQEATDEYLDNKMLTIRVVSVVRHPLLKDYLLSELVEKYSGTAPQRPKWNSDIMPGLPADQLRDALMTGTPTLDKQLKAYTKDMSDEILVAMYHSIFKQGAPVNEIDPVTEHVLAFFWARHWEHDVPDNVAAELAHARRLLTETMAYHGREIVRNLDRFERRQKNGDFIISYPTYGQYDKPIMVQAEVYNPWLKKGGTPEMVMGAWLDRERLAGNRDIDPAYKTLKEKRYARHCQFQTVERSKRKANIVAKSCSTFIHRELDGDMSKDDRTLALSRFNAFVKDNQYRCDMPLAVYCRRVICKTFFPATNALQILEAIDELMTNDESLQPREAATLASIEVVADWLVTLLTPNYVK